MFPRCSRSVSTLLATAILAASLGCSNRGGDNTVVGLPFGGGSSGSGGGAGGGGGGGAAGFAVAATNPDSGPTNGFPTLAAINNVDPATAIISVTFGETPTTGAGNVTAIDFTPGNTPLNFQVIQATNQQLLEEPLPFLGPNLRLQGVVNFDPNTDTATFVPAAINPLQLNTQYTVIIRGVVTDDANGNALSQFDYVFYFQTDVVNNFVPQPPNVGDFTVLQTDPTSAPNNGNPFAAAFRHDPTDRTLTATFSKDLDATTVITANVLVTVVGNQAVQFPGVLTSVGSTLTFTADADFPANTLVTMLLGAGLRAFDQSPAHPYTFLVITRTNVGVGDFLINEVFAHGANAAGVSLAGNDANNNGLEEPHIDQFIEYVNVSGDVQDVEGLACQCAVGGFATFINILGPVLDPLQDGATGNDLPDKQIAPDNALLILFEDSDGVVRAASPVVFNFGNAAVELSQFTNSSPTQAADTTNPPDGTPDPRPFLGNEFTNANRSGQVTFFDPIGDPLINNPIDQFFYADGLAPGIQLPLNNSAESMQREVDALEANVAVPENYLPHQIVGIGARFSPGTKFNGQNFP